MNATEINEFVTQNPGFGIREISPGVFAPSITVTASPPDPNSPGGNGGTNTVQYPAQRAASEQVQATAAGSGATPFSQDPAQRAAAQVAATNATPTPSPFSQDPAQRAAAEQVQATSAGAGASPFSLDPAQRAAAAQVEATAAIPAANPFSLDPAQRAEAAATPAGAAVVGPATDTVVGRLLTQRQQTLTNQSKMANQGDWRVRLSLAPDSNYLYNAPSKEEQGILAPLNATYGVLFPYTPKIDVGYKATYASESLTHSNYLNYFYKASSVDSVRISCPFTAQDSTEAAYLLAVIHFFRSATKMFYGQDSQRGAPPPLVFLTGLGQYQFNNHPCVITNFEYSLPADVDYIRAGSPNINGTDLVVRRTSEKNNLPTGIASSIQDRLRTLFSSQGISKGAVQTVSQGTALVPSFSKNAPTYVPTKIDISLSMYPIVTRNQASRQFSLRQFANGELVKQGFW